MAQIIKYQQGGSTSKKYGTFTIDNNKYQVDDEFINQLYSYGKGLDPKVGNQFKNIIEAVKSGEDVTYTSTGDGQLVGNIPFDTTEKQEKRLRKSRSGLGRIFGGTWGGKEDTTRAAIDALKGFRYAAPTVTGDTHNWDSEVNIEYKKDKDGKYEIVDGKRVFIKGGNNERVLRRLDDIKGIINYSDKDTFKGYGELDKQAYIDWYNKYGDEGIRSIRQRIEDGSLTQEDIEAINDFGIMVDKEPSEESLRSRNNVGKTEEEIAAEKAREASKKVFTSLGINQNPRLQGLGFTQSEDGTVTLSQNPFGVTSGYFNENWARKYPEYEELLGGLLYNNRFYTKAQVEDPNSHIYKKIDRWRYNNSRGNYNTEGIESLWGKNPDFVKYDKSQGYVPGVFETAGNNPGLFWGDVTNRYTGLPEGVKAYSYYDETTPRTSQGFVETPNYIGWDTINNKPYDLSNLQRSTNVNYDPIETTTYQFDPKAEGYYRIDLTDKNTTLNLLYNPTSKTYRLVNPRDNKAYEITNEEASALRTSSNIDTRTLNQLFRSKSTPKTAWTEGLLTFFKNLDTIDRTPVDYRQEGGTLSYGGMKVNTKESDVKEKKSVRDITKSATGEDVLSGQLTKADKSQLAAIALDLSSLVAAIPTSGNPLAAGLGYAGSVAQFKSDIERDGFQLGDLGNLALHAGLDTVTLLPGIGGIGKIAKMGKVLKSSYKTLKTALLLHGATKAVGSLSTIIDDPKKASLDDYKAVAIGLQSALGLKRAVGDKLLATKYRPKDIVKAPTKTFAERKTEFINNKLKESPDLASKYTTDGKVDYVAAEKDLITKTVKASLGTDAAKEGAGNLYNKATDSSWNPFTRFNPSNRELRNYVNVSTLRKRAISRYITENPETTGIEVSRFNVNSPYTGESIYRAPEKSSFKYDNKSTEENVKSFLESLNRMTATTSHKEGGKIIKAQGGEKLWNPFTSQNRARQRLQAEQITGVDTSNMFKSSLPQFNRFDSTGSQFETFVPKRNISLDETINKQMANKAYQDLKNPYGVKSLSFNNSSTNNSTPSWSGGSGSSLIDKLKHISPDMLMGIGDFITSTRGINKVSNKMKDAVKKGMLASQQQMPAEFYSRFSDNGLHRMYDDRIKNMRLYKNVTSDPTRMMADQLMRDMNVEQMENERDTKFSQGIDQFNDKVLGQKQNYSNVRNQIVNENRSKWGQGLAQLDMAEANRIGQQTQNIKNLIYQQRQNYAKDLAEKKQADSYGQQLEAEETFTKRIEDLYMNDFNRDPNKNDYASVLDWATRNRPSSFQAEKKAAFANFAKGQYNNREYRHSWLNGLPGDLDETKVPYRPVSSSITGNIYGHKKGGVITRFRDTDEQRYLDQQKAADKAVNDLNNNIIKLFIKMMS